MTPNNNLSCLPFYRSLDEQNARKWWVYNRIYPLFTPANMLLPFQIRRKHKVLSALDERIPAEYIYRQSDPRLGNGPIQITKIMGNTLVWNQLADMSDVPSAASGLSYSFDATKYACVINGTGSGGRSGWFKLDSSEGLNIKGHIVYISSRLISGTGGTCDFYLTGASQTIQIALNTSGIFSVPSNAQNQFSFNPNGTFTDAAIRFHVVDLTLFFNGNIPQGLTAETFERDYGYLFANPEYNIGQLINNSAEGLETVGFNKWDEEWEHGIYNPSTGVKDTNFPNLCAKNPIRVFPSTTYYFKVPETIRVCYYDANNSFISSETTISGTLTTPLNCEYITFHCATIQTYGYDICINISDPNRNGQYEPYKHSVLDLHLEEFQVKDAQGNIITITGGLKQAGSVYDEIVGNKYIRRVGVQDLGLCNWTYNSGYTIPNFATQLPLAKQRTYGTAGVNLVSPKYIGISSVSYNAVPYGRMKMDSGNQLFFIADSNYTSAASFKTAMSGVMLYYELATPIEYELISPENYPIYYGYLNGTEEVKYTGTTPVAPIRYEATPYRLLSEFKIFKADGTELADYTEQMNRMLAVKTIDDIDMLVYAANIPFTPLFPNGQYYAVMSDGLTTWYSEMFTAVNDIQPYLKIEWWDVEDFVMDAGIIVYTEPKFKNILYLDSDLAKPEYPFEEEGETRDGYFFPIKQISEKRYRFKFFASEYLLDVMRFIRMADYAQITYHGQTYKLDTFLITPEWEDNGDVASVEAEFDTATVAKKIGRGYLIPSGGDFNDDFNNDFNVD